MNIYIFDSFAFFRYFYQEQNWEIVKELLLEAKEGKNKIIITIINLGEVLYGEIVKNGAESALKIEKYIDNLPVTIANLDRILLRTACKYKAIGGISYADSFVIAAAEIYNGIIITGDPEFKKFEKQVKIKWI